MRARQDRRAAWTNTSVLPGTISTSKWARSPRVSAPAADTLRAAARSSSICATTCRGSCSPWAFRPRSPRQTLEAIRLLQEDPSIMESLHRNIRCFREEANKRHFNTCLAGETAILPILVGRDEDAFALSMALLERGVFAPSAVYPAVPARQGAAALLRHLRAQAGADRNGARHPAGDRRGTRHQTA